MSPVRNGEAVRESVKIGRSPEIDNPAASANMLARPEYTGENANNAVAGLTGAEQVAVSHKMRYHAELIGNHGRRFCFAR